LSHLASSDVREEMAASDRNTAAVRPGIRPAIAALDELELEHFVSAV
jgi:hypothetical protein